MSLTARRTEPVTILQRERSLRPDLFLILPYLALAALGIVMVYTASAPRNELLDLDPALTVRRHVVFVLIGFAVFIVSSLIGGRTLRSLSIPFYLTSVAALGLVLTPLGRELKGAQRWIQIGPLQLQPSEFAKIAVILALAVLLANAGTNLQWHHIGRAVLMVAIPAVLIFLQPDLGTMLVFFLRLGGDVVHWRHNVPPAGLHRAGRNCGGGGAFPAGSHQAISDRPGYFLPRRREWRRRRLQPAPIRDRHRLWRLLWQRAVWRHPDQPLLRAGAEH